MNGFFNADGKVMLFLSRIADLILLNLIFLICCLPIVTIGASITSLYTVTLKMTKDEESYIIKGFFKAFKDNFKQSTIIWMTALFIGIVFAVDFWIIFNISFAAANIILVLLCVFFFLFLLALLYVFPVLARFYNTTYNTVKNAFLISIANLPYTFLLLLIFIIPSVLFIFYLLYMLPVLLLIGFSLEAFLASYIYRKVLDKYINMDENK